MFEPWPSVDPSITGIAPAMELRANDLLASIERALAGQGYLEWARYAYAAELHRQLDADSVDSLDFLQDAYTQCAARIALANRLSQTAAENHLGCALALRDRLPKIALALKYGLVAAHHIPKIVSRTDLIEGTDHAADIDREIAENLRNKGSWSSKAMRDMIDATIFRRDPDLIREARKDALDNRGVWSEGEQNGMGRLTATLAAEHTALIMKRLEMLANSTCRRDPRRKSQRMSDALFAITMGREFACLCDEDQDHPCLSDIWSLPSKTWVGGVDVKLVLHAIANRSTLQGRDDEPGYLEGHGVISADHARDLATHDSTTVRPTGNKRKPAPHATPEPTAEPEPDTPAAQEDPDTAAATKPDDVSGEPAAQAAPSHPESGDGPQNPDTQNSADAHADAEPDVESHGATPAPARQAQPKRTANKAATKTMNMPGPAPDPRFEDLTNADWDTVRPRDFTLAPLRPVKPGDHYRPSAALDTYIRIRDTYCTWPGCNRSAWAADLDHTNEYNHDNPAAGGRTHPTGLKALCRFHHLLKTHSDWIDDQYTDRHGHTRTIVITPEGRVYNGPAWTGDDLFPALRNIIWEDTAPAPPRPRPPDQPSRTRSRTQAKHQRRQQERNRNRLRREILSDTDTDGPP